MGEYYYQNVVEELVEQQVERLMSYVGCCMCNRCRADVICIALNNLPSHYISSEVGYLYTKFNILRQQLSTDLTVQITAAARIVKENPHHKIESPAKK